jgi:hypothetical protein
MGEWQSSTSYCKSDLPLPADVTQDHFRRMPIRVIRFNSLTPLRYGAPW